MPTTSNVSGNISVKTFYIYQLRLANSTTPFYIGKGRGKRTRQHFTPYNLAKKSIRSSIIKNARENGVEVIVEILAEGLVEEVAFAFERRLIAHYGPETLEPGFSRITPTAVKGRPA